MAKRFVYILALLLLLVVPAKGQQDPLFSHYWAMETSFNPAAAGKESKLNIVGAFNMTLAGFENNPRTFYASGDMPLYFMKNYHGVGVQFMNDQLGLFSHKRFSAQYAYKHKLFGGMISAGIQITMINETFDGSKIEVDDPEDPALPRTSVNGSGFDFSAGLYYTHKNWYVGISALHINAPKIELGDTYEYQTSGSYYLTGGYNIKLRNPFFTILPSVIGRYDGVSYRVDVTTRVKYEKEKKMLYVGVSYSPSNSVTFLIGGKFHGVTLGYSYEMYTSAISIGNGSHGIFASYQMDINLQKKGRNLHKSIRLL